MAANFNHEGHDDHKGHKRRTRIFVIVVAFVALVVTSASVAAQAPNLKRDAGATITWLNLNGLNQTAGGLGGRISTHLVDLL